MKIGNIKVTQYQIIIAASAAAILIALYVLLYAPIMKQASIKELGCKALESQIRQAREVIAGAGKAEVERDLLTEKEVPLAIDDITKYGKSLKVSFQSIRPRELVQDPNSPCKVLPLELVVEASDKDMIAFIGSLDGLKRNLVTVTSLDVIPDKNDATKLKAAVTLNLYFLPAAMPRGKRS